MTFQILDGNISLIVGTSAEQVSDGIDYFRRRRRFVSMRTESAAEVETAAR
jgi:hypothetical protein